MTNETNPIEGITLKCETCGIYYQKPSDFKRWNEESPNVFFKWSLKFCDVCRKEREKQALKRLPEILNQLSSINDIQK